MTIFKIMLQVTLMIHDKSKFIHIITCFRVSRDGVTDIASPKSCKDACLFTLITGGWISVTGYSTSLDSLHFTASRSSALNRRQQVRSQTKSRYTSFKQVSDTQVTSTSTGFDQGKPKEAYFQAELTYLSFSVMANTAQHERAPEQSIPAAAAASSEARPSIYDAMAGMSQQDGPEQKKHKPEEGAVDLSSIIQQMNQQQQNFMTGMQAVLQQMANQSMASNQTMTSLQQHLTTQATGSTPAPITAPPPAALECFQAMAQATSEAITAVKTTSDELAKSVSIKDEEKKRKAEKISPEELNSVKSQIRSVKGALQKQVNLSKKVEKDKNILDAMENEAFPAGVNPFKSPAELADLQQLWSNTVLANHKLEIEVKQGATVEDALRTVYHWSQKFS